MASYKLGCFQQCSWIIVKKTKDFFRDETMCEKLTLGEIINERLTSESATHDGWLPKGSCPSFNGFEQADNFF
jgi:hypothetical protein